MQVDEYSVKIKAMTRDELQEELELLQEDLEDIQIERKLILGQTGVHIGASKVESLRNSFDRETSLLEQKINLVREALSA